MLVLKNKEGKYFCVDISIMTFMSAVSLSIVLGVDKHSLEILDEIFFAGLLTLIKVFEHQLF